MSAGAFETVAYEAQYTTGEFHPIKIQPETKALTIDGQNNNPVSGATVTNQISAMVGASKRQLGLHASMVSIKFTATPPTGYKADSILRLPLLSDLIRAKAVKTATGTYLGVAIVVVANYTREIVR